MELSTLFSSRIENFEIGVFVKTCFVILIEYRNMYIDITELINNLNVSQMPPSGASWAAVLPRCGVPAEASYDSTVTDAGGVGSQMHREM